MGPAAADTARHSLLCGLIDRFWRLPRTSIYYYQNLQRNPYAMNSVYYSSSFHICFTRFAAITTLPGQRRAQDIPALLRVDAGTHHWPADPWCAASQAQVSLVRVVIGPRRLAERQLYELATESQHTTPHRQLAKGCNCTSQSSRLCSHAEPWLNPRAITPFQTKPAMNSRSSLYVPRCADSHPPPSSVV